MFVVIGTYQFLISEVFDSLTKEEQATFYSLLSEIISKTKHNEFVVQSTRMQKLISKSEYSNLRKYIEKINLVKYNSTSTTILTEKKKNKSTQDIILSNNEFKNNYISLTDHSEMTSSANVSFNNFSSNRGFEYPIKLVNVVPIAKKQEVQNYQVNKHLPYIIIGVSATLSFQQFLNIVNKALVNLGFILLITKKNDTNCNIAVYEYKKLNCFNQIFTSVFLCKETYSDMKMQIGIGLSHSNDKYSRMIEIKSISGVNKDLERSYSQLIKKLVVYIDKIKILKKSKWNHVEINDTISNYINSIQSRHLKTIIFSKPKKYENFIEEESNEGSFIEETNKEASKFYHLYKILSQENYGLGESLARFISNFKNENSDIIQAKEQIPYQMKSIINMIEDTVFTFNNSFNSNQSTIDQHNYIRPSAEQFIFNKIYYIVFEIYKSKYFEENSKYVKEREILKSKSVKEIMSYLEIKPKYQGTDSFDLIPYKVSIDLINKIEYEQIPKSKLETLMKSSLELRNTILSMTNGKSELDSMDDELPLFIYLTTQISISNIVAELHFIDDYLKFSAKGVDDNKVITNLFSSVYYISNSWGKS